MNQMLRPLLCPSLSRLSLLGLLLVATGCASATAPTPTGPYSATDIVVGTGAQAVTGNRITVSYTGWLYDPTKVENKGTQFDSGASFAFTLGSAQVIRGWDQGVPGLRIGGLRRLVLPPDLAYGSRGSGSSIPPNATLVFDVKLLSIQ